MTPEPLNYVKEYLAVPDYISETQVAVTLQENINSKIRQLSTGELSNLLSETQQYALNAGLRIGDTPIPCIPIPLLIPKAVHERNVADIGMLAVASDKIEGLAFSGSYIGNTILEYFRKNLSETSLTRLNLVQAIDHKSVRRRIRRVDTFEGQYIESNILATEGNHYTSVTQKVGVLTLGRLGIPLSDEIKRQAYQSTDYHVLETLIAEHADINRGEPLKTIGILYEGKTKDNKEFNDLLGVELPYLVDRFKEIASETFGMEIEVEIVSPDQLEASNGVMSAGGKKIDVVWRNDVDWEKRLKEPDNNRGLIEIFSNPTTYAQLNDQRAIFQRNKLITAYLHNPEIQKAAGFTQSEIAAIQRRVPFAFDPSRVSNIVDGGSPVLTRDYLLRNADQYVIKPVDSTHGNGVSFGINADGWENAVDKALVGGHIAMKYIPYSSAVYNLTVIQPDGSWAIQPYYVDKNFHVMGGRATGSVVCRANPVGRFKKDIGIQNVSGGGGLVPNFYI